MRGDVVMAGRLWQYARGGVHTTVPTGWYVW